MIQELLKIGRNNPLKSYPSTKAWAEDYFQLTNSKTSFEKAVFGGFCCQQLSFAFLAGYQAALEKMFPTIAPEKITALCISEKGGGHPKAMETTLENNRVNGVKTYVTAGTEVEELLVLCKTNEEVNGKPLLKMVHVSESEENVEVSNFDLPFMKEIKHGKVLLKDVRINSNQILDGDGYSKYTKPFRTLEDILVVASYQAMLLRQAIDHNWEEDLRDQIVFNIYTLQNLLSLPPMDKETHLLISIFDRNFKEIFSRIESNIEQFSSDDFKKDWQANKKIFSLGDKMKALRLSKARGSIFQVS